jgi:hypothetical protein
MLLHEMSDIPTMDIVSYTSPEYIHWTQHNWLAGNQICMIPEQSVLPMLMQEQRQATTGEVITEKNSDDLFALYDASHVNNAFAVCVSGDFTQERYADEVMGLQGVKHSLERGDPIYKADLSKPALLDGFTMYTALTAGVHSCVSITNMNEYDYAGQFSKLALDEILSVTKSADKTWIFVIDGIVVINDTPSMTGQWTETSADSVIECLEDNSIVFVLHRNGLHSDIDQVE